MRFDLREFKLNLGKHELKAAMSIEGSLPLLVSLDDEIKRGTYKEVKSEPEKAIYAPQDTFEGNNRFIFITRVTTYINNTVASLYYDNKYKDILVMPELEYAKFLVPSDTYMFSGYRVGVGMELNKLQPILNLNVREDGQERARLPRTRTNLNTIVRLVAFSGGQAGNYAPDANSYEEMLDQNINLKRYHRQMTNLLELGTANELFRSTTERIPLYLIYQSSLRNMSYKYIGNTTPPLNAKLYIHLNF